MKTLFLQEYHMPILLILLVTSWLLVGFRLWGFRRLGTPWRSLTGLSTLLSATAAILGTIYVALTMGIFFIDQRLYDVFAVVDPGQLSSAACQKIVQDLKTTTQLCGACRLFLLLIIWTVKAGLLAVYLQVISVIDTTTRVVLQATGPILAVTLVTVCWLAIQAMATTLTYPTSADVRAGYYVGGMTFADLGDSVEMATLCLNLFTDLLLVFIAYRTIRALRYSVAAGWLMFLMGAVTVTVVLVRLVFVGLSYACESGCLSEAVATRLQTPVFVLAEIEAFAAILVSSLPAIRAAMRHGERGGRGEDESFGSAETLQELAKV